MWWGHHDGMGWWMLFGGIWMLLFWVGVVAVIVWGVRSLAARPTRREEGDSPVTIAERRYARGEITKEQLLEIKQALGR